MPDFCHLGALAIFFFKFFSNLTKKINIWVENGNIVFSSPYFKYSKLSQW